MSSYLRSRCSFSVLTLLAVLTAYIVQDLVGPPPAEAQKKKVLNIAAKEPDTLDPHTVQIVLKSFDAIFLLRMVGYQALRLTLEGPSLVPRIDS